ncbi:uncharacterized protein LOC110467167 [Mizuhopecten yessoensis]|uniref:Short-chain collagen C4 n=1 Tax=Mizuhopecten yessoensis TaxID=6573 RepID=A0A210PMG2_MIZYE|nr:uncharacterized protein LOC110467167 [Mizuhopecten yessoensis]OWF37685.1 hypothetical protein KP79_PYT09260 [Mizuhopecten yessoensis]
MLPVLGLFILVSRICPGDAESDNYVQERISLSNPSYVEQQLHDLQTQVQDLKTKIENHVLFTRWGRSDCPKDISTLVYAGYVGGSLYSMKGSAAEYVCLPSDPTWGPFKYYEHGNVGYMYGAEYQRPPVVFGVEDADAPCAVCDGTPYSMVLMIPGRVNCYPDWVEAYHGSLASGNPRHKAASEHVCVDEVPQTVPGGDANNDGKLFYGVKTVCGSLPCPPYENDKFLSCVVCMK